MKTLQVSPAEMATKIARFREIEPQGGPLAEKLGIPLAAYQKMTAEDFYLLMSSPKLGGPFADRPAISDDQNMIVAIVKCSPGQGPYLHAHYNTYENFMCLTGRFRISWGDKGEYETFLDPYDVIAVPKGVVRTFANASDDTAYILGFIRGDKPEDFHDVAMTPAAAADLTERFGAEVVSKIEEIGWRFDATLED
jgi:uncharacterized RmlC-like cupin family protein